MATVTTCHGLLKGCIEGGDILFLGCLLQRLKVAALKRFQGGSICRTGGFADLLYLNHFLQLILRKAPVTTLSREISIGEAVSVLSHHGSEARLYRGKRVETRLLAAMIALLIRCEGCR